MCLTLARQEPTRARGALYFRLDGSITEAGAVTRPSPYAHGTGAVTTRIDGAALRGRRAVLLGDGPEGHHHEREQRLRPRLWLRPRRARRPRTQPRAPSRHAPRRVPGPLGLPRGGAPDRGIRQESRQEREPLLGGRDGGPTEEGGYLSVRIKPTAGIRDVIEPLYAQV